MNNVTDRSVLSQPHNSDQVSGESVFRFAVNSSGCNKDWDYEKLATDYQDETGTLEDVVEHVMQGHAIAAGLFGGKRRCKANVMGTHWILGDIDNSKVVDGKKVYNPQLTIEQALEHPFIKKYCALIYTSSSHTDDWHRFRLVFMLPEFVERCEEIEQLVRFMMAEFPFLDPACKDASRVFYGNTAAEFPLYQSDVTLPIAWVQEAKEQARQDRIAYQTRCEELQRRKELYPNDSKDTDSLVMQALDYIPSRQPGNGNYDECTKVAMALVSHFGESEAERIIEGWSPSIRGDSWNVSKKVRSYKRSGVTIGTLFHIAKSHGFKFPAHQSEPNNSRESGRDREVRRVRDTQKPSDVIYSEDERLRLDLLDLAQEKDKISYVRKRAKICSHYRISKQEVEELIRETARKTSISGLKHTSFEDLLDMEIEELRWLIPELLPAGEMVILAGSPKSGKTLMAIDAAFSIATGEDDFLGLRSARGKVLLISNDENPRSTKSKLLRRGFRREDKDNLEILFDWDISRLYELEQLIDSYRPDVVIIDSLKSITANNSEISENSAEFANSIYAIKNLFNQYNAASILIHHTNKNKDAMGIHKLRGSTAIAGAVWGTWQLEQVPQQDPDIKNKLIIDPGDPKRILSVHARDVEGQLLALEFDPEKNSYARTDKEVLNEQAVLCDRILGVLRLNPQGLSGRGIIECLGMTREEGGRSVYSILNRMESKLLISTIKSLTDRRITLYTAKNSQHANVTDCKLVNTGGDSLPPTPCVDKIEKNLQSNTVYGIQNSQHQNENSQQLTENSQHQNDTYCTDDYLYPLSGCHSGDSQHLGDTGGGGSVNQLTVSFSTESVSIQSQFLQAKQLILGCVSRDEVGLVKAKWSDDFRKQVGSLLTEEERQYLVRLPQSIEPEVGDNLEVVGETETETALTVEDFEIGQRVKFNRAEATPSSAVRIPENVESGEVIEHSVSLVKVRWDELETPQFHKPIELSIVEKDG